MARTMNDNILDMMARIYGAQQAKSLLSLQIPATAKDLAEVQSYQTEHIPLVLSGFVCRKGAYCDSDGIAGVYMSGEMCGIDALVLDEDEDILVVGANTEVGFLPKSLLRERTEALAPSLWKASARANIRLRKWLEVIALRNASAAIAFLLCEFRARMKFRGESVGRTIRLPFTQEQYGMMLGVSAIHANRCFVRMREDKYFEHRRGAFYACDWEALTALSNYNDTYLWLNHSEELGRNKSQ